MRNDRLSRHYDAKYEQPPADHAYPEPCVVPMPANRFEAAISFCRQTFGSGSILEIGAGDGRIAAGLLHAALPFSSYLATEASQARLRALQNRLVDSRFAFGLLDIEDTEAPLTGKFDMIIMVAVIEHLLDPIVAMARLRECLNPGGFIYIDTPNIAKLSRRLKLLCGHFPSTASKDEGLLTYEGAPVDLLDEGHLHYFTYRSLSTMLIRLCGFSRTKRLGYACAPFMFPKAIHHTLARIRPEWFSEIAMLAYV